MSQQRLFEGPSVAAISSRAIAGVSLRVARFTEGELLANRVDDLARDVVDAIMGQALELHAGQHRIAHRIVPLPLPEDAKADDAQWAMDVIELSLHIPYTGTGNVLRTEPNRLPSAPAPEATVTDEQVVITIAAQPGEDGPAAERRLLLLEKNLQQWVTAVNDDVAALKRELDARARELLGQRIAVLRHRDDMVAALTIPLRQVDAGKALKVPIRRKVVALKAAPVTSGSPEWILDTAVYEQMIKTITGFTHALERRPSSARRLLPDTETLADEETLRDWIMFILGSNYEAPDGGELFIGGEVENGKGKTDILVRHAGRNAFIGECKFWHGPKRFDEAIEQLLGYTTWRDTKAAVILFITSQNATVAINKAGGRLAAHHACKKALASSDPSKRRDYQYSSPADERRTISLALLPVILPKAVNA